MAVALALLAVLQQGGDGDDEQGLDADHAEDGREDIVDEGVAEGVERPDAALYQRRGGRARALRVHDKRRRSAVQVTTALELQTWKLVWVY